MGIIFIYVQFGDGFFVINICYFQVQYWWIYNVGLFIFINFLDLNLGWMILESGMFYWCYVLQDGLDFKYEYYDFGLFKVNGKWVYCILFLDL